MQTDNKTSTVAFATHGTHARYSHQNQLLTAAQPCARLAVPTPLPSYHGKPLSPASRASPRDNNNDRLVCDLRVAPVIVRRPDLGRLACP
jgi:hypothetical protein